MARKSRKERLSRRAERTDAARRAHYRRVTIIGSIIAGALVVGGLFAFALASSSSPTGSATTSATAFDLPVLGGPGRVRLVDFRGTPTVVNFFASWCTQCDAELPGFRAAADKYQRSVNFVFVNSNDPGDGKAMARAHDLLSLPVARDVGPPNGSGLYRSLGGTGGLPVTVFYDADGHIVDKTFGALLGRDLDDAIQRNYGLT